MKLVWVLKRTKKKAKGGQRRRKPAPFTSYNSPGRPPSARDIACAEETIADLPFSVESGSKGTLKGVKLA